MARSAAERWPWRRRGHSKKTILSPAMLDHSDVLASPGLTLTARVCTATDRQKSVSIAAYRCM
jgi:hypothetical protein